MAGAAYGLWPLVFLNAVLFGALALSLFHPSAVHHHEVAHIRRESAPRGLAYPSNHGTVHPFAPTGSPPRHTPLEMQAGTGLSDKTPTEAGRRRWLPTWNAPVL